MKSTSENNAYEVVLADLRARRAKLDQAIAAIEDSMTLEGNGNNSRVLNGEKAELRNDTFFGMTIADAAEKLLEMHKKPLKANEIAISLVQGGVTFTTETPSNTVTSILTRKLSEGTFVRVSRGCFALAKWYGKQS